MHKYAGLLLALAATTSSPAVGVVVMSLDNLWPGQVQLNTSFACVWHMPHWKMVTSLSIGHYECFNSSAAARNASAGRPMVFDITGDDDDYTVPWK